MTGQHGDDRADLLVRLAELVGVLDYAEVTELASLADAMARAQGLAWGKKVGR